MDILSLGKGVIVGSIFGLGLEKSKAYIPSVIRGQFLFESYVMMDVFLAAVTSGIIGILLLEGTKKSLRIKSSLKWSLGCVSPSNVIDSYSGNILGGLLQGIGMAITGACPGTVFIQLAANVESAKYVVTGALFGTMLYLWSSKLITKKNPQYMSSKPSFVAPEDLIGSYPAFAVAASLTFGTALYIINNNFDWETTVLSTIEPGSGNNLAFPHISAPYWNSIFAGLFIGLNQITSLILLDKYLGASTAYSAMFGQVLRLFNGKVDMKELNKFLSPENISYVGHIIGMISAGYISVALSGIQLKPDNVEFSNLTYFIGGTTLLFGARLANGCASGNGLSGILTNPVTIIFLFVLTKGLARGSLSSLLTVVSMFAGGIMTAQLIL